MARPSRIEYDENILFYEFFDDGGSSVDSESDADDDDDLHHHSARDTGESDSDESCSDGVDGAHADVGGDGGDRAGGDRAGGGVAGGAGGEDGTNSDEDRMDSDEDGTDSSEDGTDSGGDGTDGGEEGADSEEDVADGAGGCNLIVEDGVEDSVDIAGSVVGGVIAVVDEALGAGVDGGLGAGVDGGLGAGVGVRVGSAKFSGACRGKGVVSVTRRGKGRGGGSRRLRREAEVDMKTEVEGDVSRWSARLRGRGKGRGRVEAEEDWETDVDGEAEVDWRACRGRGGASVRGRGKRNSVEVASTKRNKLGSSTATAARDGASAEEAATSVTAGAAEQRNVGEEWVWVEPEEDFQPRVEDFDNSTSGVNHTLLPMNCSVMDSFNAFYGRDFFNVILTETNRYASTSVFPTDAIRKAAEWKPIHLVDLYRFFAVVFHMMLVKKPTIADYFSTDPALYSSFPRAIGMGRTRFQNIIRCLHICNNGNYIHRGQPGHDRGFKIRPMFNYVLSKLKSLYRPSANLTLGEAIRPYIKSKPTKYGIRIECVCESSSGIICHMELHTGSRDNEKSNAVKQLVSRMLASFAYKNHRVFMDQRYSSPSLFKMLLELGFYPVGPVQSNRKFLPVVFKAKRLKAGEREVRICDDILATKWRDTRDVFMLSTINDDTLDTSEGRAVGHRRQHMKPASIVSYNKNKAGVDKHDQIASYYPFSRKTLKWWKKMFFHLFELGIVNIHKMYNMSNPAERRMPLVDYIRTLANEIVPIVDEHPREPAAVAESRKRKAGNHYPVVLPPTAHKATPSRRCVQCSRKELPDGTTSKRRESSWQCMECGVALCVGCFYPYHCGIKHTNV